MGFLPLFEPLLLWLVEQIQVFLFGGTSTPSFFRCMGQILVSLVHFGIIMAFQNNPWPTVILSLVHNTCYFNFLNFRLWNPDLFHDCHPHDFIGLRSRGSKKYPSYFT